MAKTHSLADEKTLEVLVGTMKKHHQALQAAGVNVGCLFCSDEKKATIVERGHKRIAAIKITPAENRVQGIEDAVITLDVKLWEMASAAQRVAIFDSMLCRIEVQTQKNGTVKRDEADRPKLKARYPDFEVRGFVEVAKRHGVDSLEVAGLKDFVGSEGGQMIMDFVYDKPQAKAS